MVSLPNHPKRRQIQASLVAIGLLTLACSNDDDSSPFANAAGGSATGGSNGSAVAGAQNTSGGSASSASAGATSSSHYGGEVSSQLGRVDIYSAGRGTPCTVDAAFYQSLSPSDCATVRDLGACVVMSGCSDPTTSAVLASAGDLTLSSAKPALDVRLTPGQGNRYSQGQLTCLSGDEALSVSAMGATVPAFAVDVNVPLVLLADSPAADSSGVVPASSSADLTLKVSRGATDVRLVVSGTSAATGVTLVCEADSTQGALTIPAAALDAVGEDTELQLYTEKTTLKAAGSWTVEVTTYMNVYTPDRTNAVSIRIQ